MSEIKKRFVYVSIVCGVLLSLFSCVSTQGTQVAPEWISSPDAVYPSADYLNGVGAGSTKKDAENEANNVAGIMPAVDRSHEDVAERCGSNYSSLTGLGIRVGLALSQPGNGRDNQKYAKQNRKCATQTPSFPRHTSNHFPLNQIHVLSLHMKLYYHLFLFFGLCH